MSDLVYKYYGSQYVNRKKYSNRSCRCWNKDHAPHASILEADLCNELNAMARAGQIKSYDSQYKISIDVNGHHICNHYVDFKVYKWGGDEEFWEAKGYDQDVWKLKKKLVEALYPGIPYIVKRQKPKAWRGNRG